jgi:hypothetical protein
MGAFLLDHAPCATLVYFLLHLASEVFNLKAETQYHSFAHLMFALAVGLCAYNFFRAVTLDPGTCPKPTSDEELKSVSHHPLLVEPALSCCC